MKKKQKEINKRLIFLILIVLTKKYIIKIALILAPKKLEKCSINRGISNIKI